MYCNSIFICQPNDMVWIAWEIWKGEENVQETVFIVLRIAYALHVQNSISND